MNGRCLGNLEIPPTYLILCRPSLHLQKANKHHISLFDEINSNNIVDDDCAMDVDDDMISDMSNIVSSRPIKNWRIIHSDEEAEEEKKTVDLSPSPIITSSENESDDDNNWKLSTTNSVPMDTELDQLNDTTDTLTIRKSSRIAELEPQSVAHLSPSKSKKKKKSQSNQKPKASIATSKVTTVVKNDHLTLALSQLREGQLHLRPVAIEDIEVISLLFLYFILFHHFLNLIDFHRLI